MTGFEEQSQSQVDVSSSVKRCLFQPNASNATSASAGSGQCMGDMGPEHRDDDVAVPITGKCRHASTLSNATMWSIQVGRSHHRPNAAGHEQQHTDLSAAGSVLHAKNIPDTRVYQVHSANFFSPSMVLRVSLTCRFDPMRTVAHASAIVHSCNSIQM